MKNLYLFLGFIIILPMFGQDKNLGKVEDIAAYEMKSASKTIQLTVNPNTSNYDITYHKLEFTVDPSIYSVAGKVTTTYTALSDMNSINFDLANELIVASVKQGTTNLTFVQNGNNELVITLPTTQVSGSSASVEITYAGAPPVNGFNAFTTQQRSNGSNTLYTLSEPFGARDWWPCKQDLNDKINSIDVYITAPSQYISVSNGLNVGEVISGANKTTHFHHGYAIPAYLICMAVTDYTIYNQIAGTSPNTYPIVNYIYPENFNSTIQTQLDQTPLILNLFESLIEPYPFRNEKYGHAQFGWGGGMEHTTVSFMVGFGRQLIAHEMGHQWFGDKITCGSWKDIWLNEGFATYMASMVIENFDGNAAFVADKTNMINSITGYNNGAIYLTDAQANDVNRIFSSRLSYNKGAMVLNMLRFKLGDASFFQAIKNYLADTNLAYKYAVTSNLQSHFEATYGQSLSEFFDVWVYKQGFPKYNITAQNFGAGQAKITVNQTTSDPSVAFFKMPLPIRLLGAGGLIFDTVVNNIVNGEQFIVNVPFTVTGVQFDVNKNIISKSNVVTLASSSFETEDLFSIYPNPASSEIHIQKPVDIDIKNTVIYNSLGQKVAQNNAIDFSVYDLSKGIYYLEISTSEGTVHKKFIKN